MRYFCPIYSARPANLTLLPLITLTMLCDENKILNLLCFYTMPFEVLISYKFYNFLDFVLGCLSMNMKNRRKHVIISST